MQLADSDVLYAGVAPNYAGLYQVNIRIPDNTPDGDIPVALNIDGISTPARRASEKVSNPQG